MVDVGYRYLNLGDVTTASDSFGAMTFKNVAAHEVRANEVMHGHIDEGVLSGHC